MAAHAYRERRTGWRIVLDPDLWLQVLAFRVAGTILMAFLACTVALVRDTTGHDWYASRKLTFAELLIAFDFDERVSVEYRKRYGTVVTLTRGDLVDNGDALLARDHLRRTAAGALELGAFCGFVSALLCVALMRLSQNAERVRHGPPARPAHLEPPKGYRRVPGRPGFLEPIPVASGSAGASEERPSETGAGPPGPPVAGGTGMSAPAPANRSPASGSPRPGGTEPAVTRQSETAGGKDRAESARRGRRKRTYGRWI